MDKVTQDSQAVHCGLRSQVVHVHALSADAGAQPRQQLEGAFLSADAAHRHTVDTVVRIAGRGNHFLELCQVLRHMVVAGRVQHVHVAAQRQAVGVLGQAVQFAFSVHAGAQRARIEVVQLAPGVQLVRNVREHAEGDEGGHVGRVDHADIREFSGDGADRVLVHQFLPGNIGRRDVDLVLQGIVVIHPQVHHVLVVGRVEIVPQFNFDRFGVSNREHGEAHRQHENECKGLFHFGFLLYFVVAGIFLRISC